MRILLATAAVLLVLPAAAHAAPPSNDARTAPQAVTLPAGVAGTTREATLEGDEPPGCAQLGASVWYSLTAADTTRIVVRLAAAGDLDATVDVFRRTRSQLSGVACEIGDANGQAEATFRPEKGATYLIRVGRRSNSVAGDFRLDVAARVPAPTAPGAALPAGGAAHTLDRVQDTADAYAVSMHAGRSYRINLSQPEGGCVSLALYPAGTRGDFDSASPVKRLRCGGYVLYTPRAGEGGRFSLYVAAQPTKRGPQPYRLQFGAAAADDTAPGLSLANYERARGALAGGGLDVVDLYRFSVRKRSDLELTLRGHAFGLQLLSDKGRRLGAGEDGRLEQRIQPGRYFVAVSAGARDSGRYVLERAARTITHTSVNMPNRAAPGQSLRVSVKVSPDASGPVQITLQRFDPLAGWQFFRQVEATASGGSAGISFTPPAQGRWRATAAFLGTRAAAPSQAGFAGVLVAPPLAAQ
ncbi:hypothetical protein [Candidatus Solirubrobacter pratensis]|uniref:hypothetical protein n=1 Tax=Candidatus Solirubrobacter pratensis TaxID=1298857 RepID=UPI000481A2FD|nr:hypothetical protein [Candidatus Solirubrobacter pratensis]